MAFSFSSFNKERLFTFDTKAIAGEYTNLESLYKKNGEDAVYQLRALYISTKSEFTDESPIAATNTTYINLPDFQLPEVKSMIADAGAVNAINAGRAGFTIETYIKIMKTKNGEKKKTCYKAVWCDVDPDDFDKSYNGDEEIFE